MIIFDKVPNDKRNGVKKFLEHLGQDDMYKEKKKHEKC